MKERSPKAFMRVPIRQRTLSEIEFQVQLAGVTARGGLCRARVKSGEQVPPPGITHVVWYNR